MAPTDDQIFEKPSIGGHFSAIAEEKDFSPPGRYGYESARASLYALLTALRPKKVHIPNYICSAIPNTLRYAGCIVETYSIGNGFRPSKKIDIRDGDLVILVNYFGLCEEVVSEQLHILPRDVVIVDNSQAYFQEAFSCLANIYSPRKFIPVADGGFIETEVPLSAEPPDEEASLRRFHYLLKRVGNEPELSRQEYLAAEKSLETPSLREMSALTRALIRAADHKLIASRRRENFCALNGLSHINEIDFKLGNQSPLAYPLMMENGRNVWEALIEMRIFTPRYWPGIHPQNLFEDRIYNNTIFLPVDHRYTNKEMSIIISNIFKLINFRQK